MNILVILFLVVSISSKFIMKAIHPDFDYTGVEMFFLIGLDGILITLLLGYVAIIVTEKLKQPVFVYLRNHRRKYNYLQSPNGIILSKWIKRTFFAHALMVEDARILGKLVVPFILVLYVNDMYVLFQEPTATLTISLIVLQTVLFIGYSLNSDLVKAGKLLNKVIQVN